MAPSAVCSHGEVVSPEKRKALRKRREREFREYIEEKKANIAANSPSRTVWYAWAGPLVAESVK